ncbi:ribose ABC transport system, ATP-binding protein RbsA [Bacillus sp. JCM 19046]|nr:ribose ABC transport system, ATP-binding protein RbsA [Bacillus sp. JCM 19046]
MNEISLAFPGVKALEQAEFEAESGEIHALIGANGAGKSTLMNILAGVHQANSGTIKIDGELVEIGTPKQALAYGIQLVHQEVDMALFPELTVTENVLSTQLITQKPLFLSWSAMHRRAEQALRELDVDIPVKKRVMDLTLAEKQLVLLARA